MGLTSNCAKGTGLLLEKMNAEACDDLATVLIARNPVVSIIRHQVIVAGVIEHEGRYLVIEEMAEGRRVINQPAGRLEADESAAEGAMRETLEESGYLFNPTSIVGFYQWFHAEKNTLYLRIAFTGELADHHARRPLDPEILGVRWMSIAELEAEQERHRSPYVMQCIRDHAAGKRFPLEIIQFFPNEHAQQA